MFKHSILSIKETEDRQFVSLEEKNKISELSDIKNDISDLETKHESINTHLNTLEEYVHNNDKVIYEEVQGTHIRVENSMEGNITDIEILGNTVQDTENLSDIKSVGKLRDDGLYEIELTSCGKNLFKDGMKIKDINNWEQLSYKVITIQLKPNTTYTISRTKNLNHGYTWFSTVKQKYDNVLWFTNVTYPTLNVTKRSFTTNDTGIIYLNIDCQYTQTALNEYLNVWGEWQIEEGDILTQCEPYQESISKIILPCQLEKVGSVCDRLFRREDGKWYIEKNIGNRTINGSENWLANSNQYPGIYAFYLDFPESLPCDDRLTSVISDKFITCTGFHLNVETNNEGIFIQNSSKIVIGLYRDKCEYAVSEIKKYLSNNNFTIKYKSSTPQIIELPLDTQIQLNSFFGITNIFMESGDVEGTIKCKVSKSLGGSINSLVNQTNQLSDRLTNIETLQEGNDLSISSDKGYAICKNSVNGYVKDIKIEGNTLVNKFNKTDILISFPNGNGTFLDNGYKIIPRADSDPHSALRFELKFNNMDVTDKTMIFMLKSSTKTNFSIRFFDSEENNIRTTISKYDTNFEYIVAKVKSETPLYMMRIYVNGASTFTNSDYAELLNFMILDGDHTNNPPNYFEGLMNVGQKLNRIDILSRKESGNLIDISKIIPGRLDAGVLGYIDGSIVKHTTDGFICTVKTTYRGAVLDYTVVEPETSYYLNSECDTTNIHVAVAYYDKDKNFISTYVSPLSTSFRTTFTTPSNTKYIRIWFDFYANAVNVEYKISNLCLNKGTTPISHESYKLDKKQVLYNNDEGEYTPVTILRGLPGAKDTIEKHSDGKYYYHKRCEQLILNGSEPWTGLLIGENTVRCHISFPQGVQTDAVGALNFMNDRFDINTNYFVPDDERIGLGVNPALNLYIRISKSRLSSHDVTGFKSWLSQNPVTVVYELANEEVHECNDIELNSYDDETLVVVESNPISPKISFTTNRHIGNVVADMKNEVNKNVKFREELTESVSISKEFNNNCEVFEDTKEGVITIDKIEGNTLVNLFNKDNVGVGQSATWEGDDIIVIKPSTQYSQLSVSNTVSLNKPNTLYTIKVDILSNTSNVPLRINAYNGSITNWTNIEPESTASKVFTYLTGDQLMYNRWFWIESFAAEGGQGEVKLKLTILEGDYLNCPITYFEGLKSVGDLEDTTYITSCGGSKNMFNEELIEYGKSILFGGTIAANAEWCYSPHYIRVDKGATYCIKRGDSTSTSTSYKGYIYVHYYSPTLQYLGRLDLGTNTNTFTIDQDCYIRLTMKYSKVKNFGIYSADKSLVYKNSNGIYEKPILRSVNNTKDTIEKHSDGKYYYHKRCGEIILDGSEEWGTGPSSVSYIGFFTNISKRKVNDRLNIYSNAFKTEFNLNTEAVFGEQTSTNIYININKSRLVTSQDLQGFKSWISQNPVTVVYQLATEEVYECNNLDLDSYEDETVIMLVSNIPTKVTATTQSNLPNIFESLKNRLKYLEEKAIEMFKLTLAGDVQSLAYELYPQDFEDSTESNIEDEVISEDDIDTLEEL